MTSNQISVLVVEDNPGDAVLLRRALASASRAEYRVTLVEDLSSLSDALQPMPYDVVLLDLSLPDSSGLDTLRRMAAISDAAPIIVLTGSNDEELGVKSVQAGAEDYVNKGDLNGQSIDRAIRYSIERHRNLIRIKESDRVKSEFLDVASHEMRTPLTIIQEFVSLVLDEVVGPINAEQRECLSDALRNCGRLTDLLNNLLDLSKLDARMVKIDPRKVDLAPLLIQCYRDFVPKCESAGIELLLQTPDETPPVFCDADKIVQAVINLLGNAWKFTPKGGRIVLRLTHEAPYARIDVEDTGIGISQENLDKIFEAFTQVDRRDGPGAKGTGLGLAITKRLIRMHDGDITVTSALGKGSIFTILLPIYNADEVLARILKERWRNAQFNAAPLSLVLLRVPTDSPHAAESVERTRALQELCRSVMRSMDCELLPDSTSILAFAFESDASGCRQVLERLRAALTGDLRGAGVEAAISELTHASTPEECIRRASENLTRLV
jgi:hypothetical protein